jgi:type IV pilus biogenesis protein CpaD/CtpE
MIFKHLILVIALLILSGCANEQTKAQPDIPTAKAPIVRESAPKISGKVVGTTEVYDRKLNKRITVTVIEKDGRYYDASDGQELFGYRPKGSDAKLKNKNQGVHELKMQ